MQTVGFPKLSAFENSLLFFLPSGVSCPCGKIFSYSISSFSSQPCLVLTKSASNALRVEEGICFPFVKHKSVENIFFMFEKENKMKHAVKPTSSS